MRRHPVDEPTRRAIGQLNPVKGPAVPKGRVPPLHLSQFPPLAPRSPPPEQSQPKAKTGASTPTPKSKATARPLQQSPKDGSKEPSRLPVTQNAIIKVLDAIRIRDSWELPQRNVRLHITGIGYLSDDLRAKPQIIDRTQNRAKDFHTIEFIAEHVTAALKKYNIKYLDDLNMTFVQDKEASSTIQEGSLTEHFRKAETSTKEMENDKSVDAADVGAVSELSPKEIDAHEFSDFSQKAAQYLATSFQKSVENNGDESDDEDAASDAPSRSSRQANLVSKTIDDPVNQPWDRELQASEEEEAQKVRPFTKRTKVEVADKSDKSVTIRVWDWAFGSSVIDALLDKIEEEVPWWLESTMTIKYLKKRPDEGQVGNSQDNDMWVTPRPQPMRTVRDLRKHLTLTLPIKDVYLVNLTFQKNDPVAVDKKDANKTRVIDDNEGASQTEIRVNTHEPEIEPDNVDEDKDGPIPFTLDDDDGYDWGFLREDQDKDNKAENGEPSGLEAIESLALQNEEAAQVLQQALNITSVGVNTDSETMDIQQQEPPSPSNLKDTLKKFGRLNRKQRQRVLDLANKMLLSRLGRKKRRQQKKSGQSLEKSFMSPLGGHDESDDESDEESDESDESDNASSDGDGADNDNSKNNSGDTKGGDTGIQTSKQRTEPPSSKGMSSIKLFEALASMDHIPQQNTPRIMNSARQFVQTVRWQMPQKMMDTYPEYVLTSSGNVKALWTYMLLVARHVTPAAVISQVNETEVNIQCWLHDGVTLSTSQMKFMVYWLVRPFVLASLYTFCVSVARLQDGLKTKYQLLLDALSTFQNRVDKSTQPPLRITADDYIKMNERYTSTGQEVTWDHMLSQRQTNDGIETLCEVSNENILLKFKETNSTPPNSNALRFIFVWVLRVVVSNTLSSVTFNESSESSKNNLLQLMHVTRASLDLVQVAQQNTPVGVSLPVVVDKAPPSLPQSVETPSRHQVRTIFAPSKFEP
jgi:hypothetical protein